MPMHQRFCADMMLMVIEDKAMVMLIVVPIMMMRRRRTAMLMMRRMTMMMMMMSCAFAQTTVAATANAHPEPSVTFLCAPLRPPSGYGGRVPLPCTLSALILILQCLTQLVLEAVCVGLVFARLSHPKARGRSIFISESAVIARRDGALKL